MTIESAQLIALTFKVEQQNLSDLLSGTDRWYQPIPIFEEQQTGPGHPDSREAKVLAKLLPSNPHFKKYVRQAREVLGIPREGVDRCDTTEFARELAPISIDKHIGPWLWGAWWLAIHLVKSSLADPQPVQGLPSSLPQWLQEYGLQDAVIAVPEKDWPRWTERSPRYPVAAPTTAERAPIDIITGLFLSAFDLPSRCFNYIRWYILTDDETFLKVGANPLEVQIDAPICQDGRVRVRLTIDGIDSSTTKPDWDEVWDQRIAPFLKAVYINEVQSDRWQAGEELGGTHLDDLMRRGRQGHKSGMKTPEYAGFFEFFLNHLTGDLEEALTDYVTEFPEDPFVNGETDLRTLKTNVDRLENIMRPRTKIA